MNARLMKLLKLHKLHKPAGEHGSPAGTGGTETGEPAAGGNADETGEAKPEVATPAAAAVETPEEGGAKGDDKPKPSDSEAVLLRDVMKHKGRANQLQGELEALRKQFEGVDIEAYRQAQAEKAEAERKKLEDRGEYDRLVAQMGERHTQAMQENQGKLDAASKVISDLQVQISELTVGNSFATSPVIGEELMMTRAKARAVYGSHFDFTDGKVVGYDKPKGASERTMLVTASGEPMSFNDALMHLVNTDPDPERDRLIRSKAKPGAGSATSNAPGSVRKTIARPDVQMSPAERIAAGLRAAANR